MTNLRWFLFDEQAYRVSLAGLRWLRKKEKTLAVKQRRQLVKRQEKFGHLARIKEDAGNKAHKEYVFLHPTLTQDFPIDPHYAQCATSQTLARELRSLQLARAFILGIPYNQVEPTSKKKFRTFDIASMTSYLLHKGLHFDHGNETLGWFVLISYYLPESYMTKKIVFEKKDFLGGQDIMCNIAVSRWLNGLGNKDWYT